MNWILGVIFIVFSLIYYTLIGKISLKFLDLKESYFSKTIVTGFLIVVFIQWLIGFPCQLLHLSWNVYFSLMLVANSMLFSFAVYYHRHDFRFDKKKLLSNMKNYWFLYVLVVVFSIWSMSSQLPYYIMNYDDHYYLGAIIQQTNSAALSTENFFNGIPMDMSISRLINTFEINYAFWANLFHIYPVFFARAVMVIHNYLIVFLAFHAFFSIFKHISKENVQYVLMIIVILLIPAGYLEQENIIRVYDGWQMNTAIWYGGSLVRLTCLPVMIMYAYEITEKITFKKAVLVGIVCASYISFSSIAVPFIIMGMLMGWLLLSYRVYLKTDKYKFVYAAAMVMIMLATLKIGPKILELIIPSQQEKMIDAVTAYRNMKGYYINDNYLYLIASSMILFNFIIKKNKEISIIGLMLLVCAFICYGNLFDKFLVLISMKYDFVALRLITGFQILLLLFTGYYIVDHIVLTLKGKFLPIISLAFLILINVFNIRNMDLYTSDSFNRAGTGVSIFGYSFGRLMNNRNMAPQIYKDLYTYFQQETDERHRIINPMIVHYETGNLFLYAGMGFAANNIEACITDANQKCDDMTNGDIRQLSDYASGVSSYDKIQPLLNKYNIEYVLTSSDDVVTELNEKGFTVVMISKSSNHDIFSLVKIKK